MKNSTLFWTTLSCGLWVKGLLYFNWELYLMWSMLIYFVISVLDMLICITYFDYIHNWNMFKIVTNSVTFIGKGIKLAFTTFNKILDNEHFTDQSS